MKAYTKSLWRTVSSHIGRFIAITAIIALGIGFTAGLSDVHPKLIDSLDAYYKEYGTIEGLRHRAQDGSLHHAKKRTRFPDLEAGSVFFI